LTLREGGAQVETCKKGHPLTPENIYVRPNGYTECRECSRANFRAWYEKNPPGTRKPPKPRGLACKNGHPYTPETTYIRPDGRRRCRICHRAAAARREAKRERKRKKAPVPERPRETLVEWTARVYREQHQRQLDQDRAPTPDLLEVMAQGGHCPPIIGAAGVDAWSADMECEHGRVPAEDCEHGCHKR
jgi:hypothetical protein